MTRNHEDLFIFYKKYNKLKLELVVSVHVYDVFIAGSTETLQNLKELIKLEFNIQDSVNVKNFLGVYY